MRLGPATVRRESVPWPVQAGGIPSSPFEGEEESSRRSGSLWPRRLVPDSTPAPRVTWEPRTQTLPMAE